MSKSERLFNLIRAIEDGRRHTSDSLATLLNVTPRTIYRDIKVLRQQGWRIPGGAGVGVRLYGPGESAGLPCANRTTGGKAMKTIEQIIRGDIGQGGPQLPSDEIEQGN